MPTPLLTILARGKSGSAVTTGVTAGLVSRSINAAINHNDNNDDGKKGFSKTGLIIGISVAVGAVIFACVLAYYINRQRRSKPAQGTRITEAGGTYEEVSPLAGEGYPMAVGGAGQGPRPMMMQPDGDYQPPSYLPPQGGYPMGAQGGYPMGPDGQYPGQQGTYFYRNQ